MCVVDLTCVMLLEVLCFTGCNSQFPWSASVTFSSGVLELQHQAVCCCHGRSLALFEMSSASPVRNPNSLGHVQSGRAHDKEAVLENMFAKKATATLNSRACSVGLFVAWHRTTFRESMKLPPGEAFVYTYVEHLRLTASPATRGDRFTQALNFCDGVLGIRLQQGAISTRVKGAVERMLDTQRVTVKAPPLTTAVVVALQRCVAQGVKEDQRLLAGFLLFLVFARMRCSDASRIIEEPVLDEAADGSGYFGDEGHVYQRGQVSEAQAGSPSGGSRRTDGSAGEACAEESPWHSRKQLLLKSLSCTSLRRRSGQSLRCSWPPVLFMCCAFANTLSRR